MAKADDKKEPVAPAEDEEKDVSKLPIMKNVTHVAIQNIFVTAVKKNEDGDKEPIFSGTLLAGDPIDESVLTKLHIKSWLKRKMIVSKADWDKMKKAEADAEAERVKDLKR
jgi:hypothetical protein